MAEIEGSVIELTLPFPPSVNALYDGGHKSHQRFKNKRYKEWLRESAQALLGQEYVPFAPHLSLEVHYRLSAPDERRRDLANCEKALSDFLVSSKIISDDSMIHRLIMEWDETISLGLVKVLIVGYNESLRKY